MEQPSFRQHWAFSLAVMVWGAFVVAYYMWRACEGYTHRISVVLSALKEFLWRL